MTRTGSGATRTSAPGTTTPSTPRIYEDLGLFTADEEITADVADLFNFLTGFSEPQAFRKLLVAPFNLREGLVREIQHVAAAAREGDDEAAILIKVNALHDARLIKELYAASEAGAKIDLIVRNICGLRPGVKGLSETIRVRSVLGRFLEHSRFFIFRRRDGSRYFLGSADLLPRNLDGRIEVVTPVEARASQTELDHVAKTLLEADAQTWELHAGRIVAPSSAVARGRASHRARCAHWARARAPTCPRDCVTKDVLIIEKRVRWALPTIGGSLATKKQKARAAAAGKEPTGKPKPKKKTSRGK